MVSRLLANGYEYVSRVDDGRESIKEYMKQKESMVCEIHNMDGVTVALELRILRYRENIR